MHQHLTSKIQEAIAMSPNLEALPPELQQRVNAILSNSHNIPETPHQAAIAPAPAAQAAPPPAVASGGLVPVRKPSLMEHVIGLRHEVAALQGQIMALGQVTEATGQAVAELYQVFVGHTPVNGGAPQGGADEF
jgi:hypothetical protein